MRILPPITKRRPKKKRTKKEKTIEANIRDWFRFNCPDAWNLKFSSPGNPSVPDRVILMERGLTVFLELKREGHKPTDKQFKCHQRLRGLGYAVYCIDNEKTACAILEYWYRQSKGEAIACRLTPLSD